MDGNGKEWDEQDPEITGIPPELHEIEQDFARRSGIGMWISDPRWG